MNQKTSPIVSVIIVLLVAIFAGVLVSKNKPPEYNNLNTMNDQKIMKIESNIFSNNGKIPVQYTCDGTKTMIPLQVKDVPNEVKSLAIIVDDPDAPNGEFVHWVIWNIDPKTSVIESDNIPAGSVEGLTGLNKPGWVAPCPPSGVHHYNFRLYALDTVLSIPESSAKGDLVAAMDGHVIYSSTLVGLYGKGY